jgi:2-aminoethylphosphonate transport system permease protein
MARALSAGGIRASRVAFSGAGWWITPPLAVLGVLFFYPMSLLVTQALTGGGHALTFVPLRAVLGSALFAGALLHTLTIAVAASAGCVTLGFSLALILSFVPFPGSLLIARAIDTFIALPTFLIALAFTFIYGSAGFVNGALSALFHLSGPTLHFLYTPAGVILAEITVYTPFVMRPLLAAFSLIEAAQIEVASSLGAKHWRIIREVILPAAMPALVAGGSLCLLLTVNELGIVLFIGAKGVTTLPLLVYDKAIQEFDYTSACVIAALNVILSIGLYSIYRVTLSRFGAARARLV